MSIATALRTLTLTIDDRQVTANEGDTVMEAALAAGIDVPRLCYDPRLEPTPACRLCIVEVEGMHDLPTACTTKVAEGMVVRTETDRLASMRKTFSLQRCTTALPLPRFAAPKLSGWCRRKSRTKQHQKA